MKKLISTLLFGAFALSVMAAELFTDNFPGEKIGSHWSGSGGTFSVADNALTIRSEKSNPVLYLNGKNWKNYRVTLNVTRPTGSRLELYVGWRYPEFVKLVFSPPYPGTLKFITAKGETAAEFNYAQKVDAKSPLAIEVDVLGRKVICRINGVEIGTYEAPAPVYGSIALGGEWNSNLQIRNLTVTQLEAPAEPKPPVVDRFTRPEIRNGTFYVDGKPTFMLGVNDSQNFWEFGKFNAEPPFAPNDVFTDLMSRETAKKMGFNSLHVPTSARQAADSYLEELKLTPEQADQLFGLGYPQHWSERARHRERVAGIPLVVDYSALHLFTMPTQRERLRKAGFPAEFYHDGGFMPYVPEVPLGRAIYNTYFRGGAEYWLNYGNSNPWVYELFNEVQWYHSKHLENRKLFGEWLRKKYGTLDHLRAVWGEETPASFESVVDLTPWSGKAMKADWMMFLGDRFVEVFNDGKAAIQSVDPRRSNVYFDIEIAVASVWYEQNGIDYYKLMKAADLFGTEGGMPFGLFAESGKSYLDDVMNNSKIKVMFVNDLARSFAGDKPILNQEAYVKRTHGKLGIVPTRRSDFPTLFWFEVFHNFSGSQVYCWWQGYRNNGWKTLEDARKTTKTVPPALLNPYAYPFESLKGFKDFETEIGRLAEIALPYPRVTQEIGILYSLPSVWRQPHAVSGNQKFPYQQNCFHWYDAFLRRQLPVAVITEQELIERGPGSFKVIAVPYPSHTFAETPEKLREFAKNGGIVLVGEGSMKFDPYGRELKNSKLSGKNVRTIPAGIPSDEQAKRLNAALDDAGYRAPFRVTSSDEKLLSELEARVIRRPGTDLYFFCNWDSRTAGTVQFHPARLSGNRIYVTDMVRMAPMPAPSGKLEWSASELAAGLPVAIPSQERVLIAVSTQPFAEATNAPLTAEAVRKLAADAKQFLDAENAKLDRELTEVEAAEKAAFLAARKPYPANPRSCVPLDLSDTANMGFRDDAAGDRKGGWTDQGAMDFREFPTGKQTFAGVPFQVIDPAGNDGKSCIVLAGTVKYFPQESADIKVGGLVKNLYFLHTAAWGGQKGRQFEYRVTYKDGTTAVIPVNGGSECADWVGNTPISNGSIVAETAKPNGVKIGAYVTSWKNPHPDKPVQSIKAVSAAADAVPIIIAITAER
ncbi:beta-galactosidase trimerization domain-containing protein [uncultured Victivallis sp.]|uniref:beta-galactosidase trimerization domain-containing protein n=1 Tax=uncultured Victivallis sp. TaxID=354118 RepID=UPI0025D597C8|nr:beta-galactosidase trimerization domain-containing protein [uncultured Victivallis sp.]